VDLQNQPIVHASGASRKDPLFISLCNKYFNVSIPDDVTVVTYSDEKAGPYLLEKQLLHNGIHYVTVKLDGKYHKEPFWQKIHAFRDALPLIKTKWILALDAFDVILRGGIEGMLRYVKENDLDAFFGAEWGHWPHSCMTSEKERAFHPNSLCQYLNSGVILMKRDWIDAKTRSLTEPVSDQPFYKELYVKEFPKVDIDHESRFVLNLNGLDRERGLYTKEENERLVLEARKMVSSIPAKELGVIFLSHRTCGATYRNYSAFKEFNPSADVVMVNLASPRFPFGYDFSSNDFCRRLTHGDKELWWINEDALYYEYYRRREENCKRWLLAEWDLFCNGDVKDFFGPLWDKPFVSADIHSDIADGWYWFRDIDKLPKKAHKHAAGASILAGTLISDECMEKIVLESWWVGLPVFCELRIATLAKMAGFELNLNQNAQGLRWKIKPAITGRGLWHPMKE